jgi:PAS domain-containing protein
MAMTLSDLFVELAQYAISFNQPTLAHISRMAALEAQGKDIPVPLLGWNIVGMWDWDAVNDVTYLDEKCAELFNVDPEAAKQGLPISDYIAAIHPEDAPRVGDAIMQALKNGGPYESRYRVISNGRIRNVVARGACTLDASGRAVRFPGVILELPGVVS